MSPEGGDKAYVMDASSGGVLLEIDNPHYDLGAGEFGAAVTEIEGKIMVGAPAGLPGDESVYGAVYIFSGTTGELVSTLPNPETTTFSAFGAAVAAAGANAMAGAPYASVGELYAAGAAHLFTNASVGAVLSLFEVEWVDLRAVLRWRANPSPDVAGFNVYRETGDGGRERINDGILPCDAEVEFVDASAPLEGCAYWLQVLNTDGSDDWFGTLALAPLDLPALRIVLEPNRPNPFNPRTTFAFTVSAPTDARLSIYDLRGSLVKTLLDRTWCTGHREVTWTGHDEQGNPVCSGAYMAVLETGERTVTRKILLAR